MAKTNGSSTSIVGGGEEPSWSELLGSRNWEGLLDPLNLSLRRFIIRCGDFCQCVNDAFNNDKNSPYHRTCRYGEKSFFSKVKFEFASDYVVSSLLHGTSPVLWEKKPCFMGYVAVSTDAALGRREIYVVWRGTEDITEWIDDIVVKPVPVTPLLSAADDGDPPRVTEGWLSIYLSVREQLMKTINQLIQEYKDGKNVSIVVIGHSLGGALAVLSAFDLVENCVASDNIPVAAVVFGCPNVGDAAFAEKLMRYPNLTILHTRNAHDHVPDVPEENRPVGVELQIDGKKSPALKQSRMDVGTWQNLQGMLHVVAGWQGKEPFEVVVERSLALVNKTAELLKDEYNIPGAWWAVENKGMVLNHKGDWVLAPPLQED